MVNSRKIRTHMICAGAALLLSSAAVAAADPAPQEYGYAPCMALARTQPEKALEHAKVLWEARERAASRHCVATALFNMGRAAQAAKVLDDLARDLKTAPPDQRAELAAQAGRAWLDAGDAPKAVAAFTQALAATPDDARLLIERAVAHGAAGHDFKAIDDLNRAVELAPASADARVLRAAAYRRVDAPELAQENLEAALRLDPGHPDGWLELGLLRQVQGDHAGARVALEKAAALGGTDATGEAARAALAKLPR